MKLRTLVLCAGMAASTFSFAAQSATASDRGTERMSKTVRHELNMIPYVNVFDYLAFNVDDNTVTLTGEVTNPVIKSEAANVVKKIEGVEHVNNQIQVLPLSSMDDRIRIASYRTIFSKPGLDRYAMQAVPPIHIIVDNGKVTLEGVVASQADKDLAGIQANTVSGVFSVTNNLRVESDTRK